MNSGSAGGFLRERWGMLVMRPARDFEAVEDAAAMAELSSWRA